MAKIKIKLEELNRNSIEMLTREGVSQEDAEIVIQCIQEAEFYGVESHGYMRLSSYVDRLKKRLINPVPNISMEKMGDSILKVDGDGGLGQVVTQKALERCMEEAQEHGVCIAAIANSNHFGTCGYFGRIAARKGFIAFITSNAAASMPPFGGMDNLLGTNPFAVSFPAGKYDNFTLDIALTTVARGKIRIYDKMNKEIPIGWAMDAQGRDTTSAREALEGGLLPMGGHKGYGMAMAVDMLCGVLSGAKLSHEIESMFKTTRPAELGHFIAIIDLSKLIDMNMFTKRVEEWFDTIKGAKLREGYQEVLIPGELENGKRQAETDYIEILDKTLESILGRDFVKPD